MRVSIIVGKSVSYFKEFLSLPNLQITTCHKWQ